MLYSLKLSSPFPIDMVKTSGKLTKGSQQSNLEKHNLSANDRWAVRWRIALSATFTDVRCPCQHACTSGLWRVVPGELLWFPFHIQQWTSAAKADRVCWHGSVQAPGIIRHTWKLNIFKEKTVKHFQRKDNFQGERAINFMNRCPKRKACPWKHLSKDIQSSSIPLFRKVDASSESL